MRVTSKGQVTIPRDLRDLAGIEPGGEVVFALDDGRITITRKQAVIGSPDRARLDAVLAALDRLEGSGNQALDADAVMKLTRDR
jgi:AbrB family looped-hinge helix DNA binding protein